MPALGALLLAAAVSDPAAGPSPPATPVSPVTVAATASKAEVTVGEVFTIELEATGPAGTTFAFPGEASTDAFELRTPAPDPASPPAPGTHRYEAAVYAIGDATIPPLPVRYVLPGGTAGEAQAAPIELRVVSLLPRDPQEQKLADIRGPQAVGIGRAFWVALVALTVLLAAVATWLVRRRRRVPAPVAAVAAPVAPDVEALRALDELAASGLAARGEYRAFYIRLTEVAKRYLERRLGAPVLEMTSAETVAFLRESPHGGELLPVVRDLAGAADRIKFARGEGLAAEADRHLAATRALVPALEARLRPAATGDAAEGRAA